MIAHRTWVVDSLHDRFIAEVMYQYAVSPQVSILSIVSRCHRFTRGITIESIWMLDSIGYRHQRIARTYISKGKWHRLSYRSYTIVIIMNFTNIWHCVGTSPLI